MFNYNTKILELRPLFWLKSKIFKFGDFCRKQKWRAYAVSDKTAEGKTKPLKYATKWTKIYVKNRFKHANKSSLLHLTNPQISEKQKTVTMAQQKDGISTADMSMEHPQCLPTVPGKAPEAKK